MQVAKPMNILTLSQAATLTGQTKAAIYQAIRSGKLSAMPQGTSFEIELSELLRVFQIAEESEVNFAEPPEGNIVEIAQSPSSQRRADTAQGAAAEKIAAGLNSEPAIELRIQLARFEERLEARNDTIKNLNRLLEKLEFERDEYKEKFLEAEQKLLGVQRHLIEGAEAQTNQTVRETSDNAPTHQASLEQRQKNADENNIESPKIEAPSQESNSDKSETVRPSDTSFSRKERSIEPTISSENADLSVFNPLNTLPTNGPKIVKKSEIAIPKRAKIENSDPSKTATPIKSYNPVADTTSKVTNQAEEKLHKQEQVSKVPEAPKRNKVADTTTINVTDDSIRKRLKELEDPRNVIPSLKNAGEDGAPQHPETLSKNTYAPHSFAHKLLKYLGKT